MAAAHTSRRALDTMPLPTAQDMREVYPSIHMLQALSLSYGPSFADYYWLKTLAHSGDRKAIDLLHPNLEALLTRTLALDPYFYYAYYFAGLMLTLKGMDPAPAIPLLEQGMHYRPDKWELGLLLGFTHYFLLGNETAAAKALLAVAKHPEAPPYVLGLASRVSATTGQAESALMIVDAMLASTQDAALREELEKRRKALRLEIELVALADAVDRFKATVGQRPHHLMQLVDHGLIAREALRDPFGNEYAIGADGNVTTSSERLRVHK